MREEPLPPQRKVHDNQLDRRSFLKFAAGAAAAPGAAFATGPGVSLVGDPDDPIVASAPVQWAAGELQASLSALGVSVQRHATADQAPATGSRIILAGARAPAAQAILQRAGTPVPQTA